MAHRLRALVILAAAFACSVLTGAVLSSAAVAYKQPAEWRHLPGIGQPKKIRCCFRYDFVVRGLLGGDWGQSADAPQRGRYLFQWGIRARGIDLFVQYYGHHHDALLFPLALPVEAHFATENDGVEHRIQNSNGDFVYTPETDFYHCKPLVINHHFRLVRRKDVAPLFYWNFPDSVGYLGQLDRRQIPHGCSSYFEVNSVPGPLYSDPRWNDTYKVPVPSYNWAATGDGSRTLVCTVSKFASERDPQWQFKGVREAYVKVTHFPFSRLGHYLNNLIDQQYDDAFNGSGGKSRFPAAMPNSPFNDAINNPSAPFGPGNPHNGCHGV